MSEPVEIAGTLTSGLGEGAHFTAIDWVVAALQRHFGFRPWPGTLNLQLDATTWAALSARLAVATGILVPPPPGGHCGARCYAVEVAGREPGVLLFPDVPGYPAGKLEIVAPRALRPLLGVRDGDRVTLRIWLDHD